MYPEEDYIMISALQHYVFCPRQCGLIHVQGFWAENGLTAKGRIMHKKADSLKDETRGETKIVRSLNIYSNTYGLTGRADVVEFHQAEAGDQPYPIEYKLGKPKLDDSDFVQLCAQALCLEEMLNVSIPEGAMFYGKTRHRQVVHLDAELREKTTEVINRVHEMKKGMIIPEAQYEKKCKSCSLYDGCLPKLKYKKIDTYIKELFTINEEAP